MYRHPIFAIVVVVVGLVLLANLKLHAQDPQQEASGARQQQLAIAARKAYDASQRDYEKGLGRLESLYRWSLRLRAAEITAGIEPAKANADHQQRMQELYERVRRLHQEGAVGGSSTDLAYVEYYWLESQTYE